MKLTDGEFRNTFKTSQGKKTFAFLLWKMKTFSTELQNEGDIALHNLGIEMLQMVNPDREEEVIESFIDSIMNLQDLQK